MSKYHLILCQIETHKNKIVYDTEQKQKITRSRTISIRKKKHSSTELYI